MHSIRGIMNFILKESLFRELLQLFFRYALLGRNLDIDISLIEPRQMEIIIRNSNFAFSFRYTNDTSLFIFLN